MNVAMLILGASAIAVGRCLVGLRHLSDARNVSRLARHFGWARSDAADANAMARQEGFGHAYRTLRGHGSSLVV